MHIPDILTPRLRLVAITHACLDADSAVRPDLLGPLVQAVVPAAWPPQDWEPHVFDFLRAQYAQQPRTIAWTRYIIIRAPSVLIGTIGAFPQSPQEVEVGYGILRDWERKGYATEALRALLALLFLEPGVTSAIAHTFPHLSASLRVLEKCGFQPAGSGAEPGTLRFRLAAPTGQPAAIEP